MKCGHLYRKKKQYWLWYAIDHKTGAILAYVFGRRKHIVFKKLLKLLKLLKPYKIRKVYADGNYAYGKYISHNKVNIGKYNTQKIERIHLLLRTWVKRLARKTICFSKTHKRHLFLNSYNYLLHLFYFKRVDN